jgi:DNA-binding CsgD family transcriptional regulator
MIAAMDRVAELLRAASDILDRSRLARLGTAAVLVLLGLLLREALLPGIGDRSPFLTFVVPVLLAAVLGGWGAGLFATALSAVIAVALYLPPIGAITLSEPSDLVRVVIFLIEGLVVTAIGAALRRAMAARRLAVVPRATLSRLGRGYPGGHRALDEPLVEPLSDRELEVIRLVAVGLRNDEIAATLFVSVNTVKTHLAHAYAKLGVRGRTEAVARCASLGLLDRDVDHVRDPDPGVPVGR